MHTAEQPPEPTSPFVLLSVDASVSELRELESHPGLNRRRVVRVPLPRVQQCLACDCADSGAWWHFYGFGRGSCFRSVWLWELDAADGTYVILSDYDPTP